MDIGDKIREQLPILVEGLEGCWRCPTGMKTARGLNLAGQRTVHEVLDDLVAILFPGCHGELPASDHQVSGYLRKRLQNIASRLKIQIARAFEYQCTQEQCEDCDRCAEHAEDVVAYVLQSLKGIQEILQSDIVAAYEGDPAAKSTMEVVMSYPGVYAITVHRLAHLLYEKNVPLIPRVMSEFAHSRTGIDIHPGARIGRGFFIDHGTGVVIGETCTIGEHVKLYQGVTLGALSFEKDEYGHPIKGIKRHPNVEDHVVIYAGATILGGKTTIGSHSEIGGNVWLIHSVPPGSKVYNQQPRPLIRQTNWGHEVANGPWTNWGDGI